MAQGEIVNNQADEGFVVNGPTQPELQDFTTGKLLQAQLKSRPEQLAVVSRWQDKSLTYRSLFETSRDIARCLVRQGVEPKDRVVVLAGNSIEYVQLFFAVGSIGGIFTIINPTFTQDEITAAIGFIEPKVVFIADRIGYRSNKKVLQHLAGRESGATVVQLGADEEAMNGILSWKNFCDIQPINYEDDQDDMIEKLWADTDTHAPLCIQFTSGTTGPRKAAVLTHHNLLNNAYQVGLRLHLDSDDVVCCSPPLFHCFGLVCGPITTAIHGAKAVIPSDVFNAEASLQACVDEGCTAINAVAAMFEAMLDHANGQISASDLRLRTGIIAGSALSERLLQRLDKEFGLDGLSYAFGMTELSCISFMTDPAEVSLLQDRTSVGTPLPHTSAKVVDEQLRTVQADTRGELLVSGYLMFDKYYKNEVKTEEAVVEDGAGRKWLRTGDIVQLNNSGSAAIVGRLKDMIKKGGENIAPADIENVLQQHPDIAACAVIGIADVRLGETVGAYIARNKHCTTALTSKGIKTWLRGRLAAHKIPDYVFWIGENGTPDSLPINASGKVLKTELAVNAKQLLSVA